MDLPLMALQLGLVEGTRVGVRVCRDSLMTWLYMCPGMGFPDMAVLAELAEVREVEVAWRRDSLSVSLCPGVGLSPMAELEGHV